MAHVLVVDNEPGILSVLSTLLRAEGYDVTPMRDSEKALATVKGDNEYDLMIFDIRMSPIDGMQLLKEARAARPATSVLMLTAHATVETAIEALKIGAFDYVTKPFEVDELLITIQRALDYTRAVRENMDLKAQLGSRYAFENIVSESAAMKNVCDMIERVAPTDATVLIYGESGTGKELVAKAIHAHSQRNANRFVAVNCAAMPETLLESELFGHAKGAFTGATATKKGLFEVADGGTIFLDEISSMSLGIQSKLLRVLQEKEIRRVGGNEDISVDMRLVAATNTRLEEMIEKKEFREDLYYRLSVIPLEIKPLRERNEDILPLAYHFIRTEVPSGLEPPNMDPEAREVLMRYPWPGNVRELENAMKHAVTFVQSGMITREVLPPKILDAVDSAPVGLSPSGMGSVDIRPLKTFLRLKEREYVSQVIEHMDGDKLRAAEALQISLATLYRKLPDPM